MVDQEVVDILADLKQRVQAAQLQTEHTSAAAIAAEKLPAVPDIKNRYAGLAVLARAWDRLPPLVSNRSGTSARLELWIKGKLKRALKWITWEQVNFNAATHRTLLDLIDSLAAYEQQLQILHQQVAAAQEELSSAQRELTASLKLRARKEQLDLQQGEINVQRSLISSQRADLEAQIETLRLSLAQDGEVITTFREDLLKEFRERDERLLDEQRVCFKQLSIQMTESQVLQDRARRELDARVQKLERQSSE